MNDDDKKDLKKLWDEEIKKWCESVDGEFDTDNLKWIKFCRLPGNHLVRFWNSGDIDPPKRIGVMVYPETGGNIDLGELEKIGNDWLIINAIQTKGDEHLDSFSNYFSEKTIEGNIFSKKDNDISNMRDGACFRVNVHINEHLREIVMRKKMTPEDYKIVCDLEKQADKIRPEYKKYHELEKEYFEKHLDLINDESNPQYDIINKKYDEYRKKEKELWKQLREPEEKAQNIRKKYPELFEYDGRVTNIRRMEEIFKEPEYQDIQVKPSGGTSGEIYHYQIDLPCGPPPKQMKEKRMDTTVLTPAPYSTLNKIPEESWENEFKTKPDAIDFYIGGTHTAATLSDLKSMGKNHVRILFPSGRVEEYDLNEFLP